MNIEILKCFFFSFSSLKTHHGGNAKLSSKGEVNVLAGDDHYEVVEEAEADEGERVVVSQLF